MKNYTARHVCTKTNQANFIEPIKQYKAGKFHTLRDAYNWMTTVSYSELGAIDGKIVMMPLPPGERPTLNQFYYYAKKHMAEITVDAESRAMPSEPIEIDACEMNVTLVSGADEDGGD